MPKITIAPHPVLCPEGASFEARSGNVNHPAKNWSPWSVVPVSGDGGRLAAPPARFLQYRATLNAALKAMGLGAVWNRVARKAEDSKKKREKTS